MALFSEIWTRPGDANFGRVIDSPPNTQQSFHDGMNLIGDGSMRLPATFDRFDEILYIDQTTPGSSVNSMVRLFDDSDPTTPIGEWLPQSLLPSTDKFDLDVDVAGFGIKSIMSYARIEPYDWDGSDDFTCGVCDWVYGGSNLLSNPGFENTAARPQEWELAIDATAGTYTLSDGTDTTSAIAFSAQASTIATRIQSDLGEFTDVVVTGTSVSPYYRTITAYIPATGLTLTIDDSGLTGSGTITETEEGEILYGPWESNRASTFTGPPSSYDQFGISSAVTHSGSQSLAVNPGTIYPLSGRNPGIQQVVNVTPGQTYQWSVWIYPTSASDIFRIAVYSFGGDEYIDSSDPTVTANQWNQLSLPDVVIPEGVTQVRAIVHWRNYTASSFEPSLAYFDDGEFNEGLQATTFGAIFGDLYDDATSDHAPARIVWEDEANPGTPYLTLDFTDSVDSGGNSWAHPEIQVKLWMRMSYLQVLDQFSQTWGYEWRVVPNDVEAGTWLLQIYNAGGMQTDYTSSQSPAIQGGTSDVRRSVRRFMPDGTDQLVEGLARITARERDDNLILALGRIEASRIDRELPSSASVADAAFEDKTEALTAGQSYEYDLVEPQDVPLVAYQIGDRLTIEDPPEVSDTGRLADIEIVIVPTHQVFGVTFVPTTAAGS